MDHLRSTTPKIKFFWQAMAESNQLTVFIVNNILYGSNYKFTLAALPEL
jgi:hypothetical protein